ncbi:Multidrug resistance-associated protein 4, partial [Trachymyrmex septentrionalis]
IMNLLSNNVIRFDQFTMYPNYIWIIYLIILYLMKIFMNNNVVKVVKMYAWEKPFSQIVSVTRKLEIKQYKMSTYFNIFQLVVALYFPLGLILLSESIVSSIQSIEDNFLLMDEVNTRCFSEKMPQLQFKSQKPQKTTNANNQIDRYILRNAKILLFKHQRLSDLSVYVNYAVVGAAGSGKSSMLHLLLKEVNPSMGSVILTQGSLKYNFPGNLSTGYFTNNPNLCIFYASQQPWLFDVTVRDNILFG